MARRMTGRSASMRGRLAAGALLLAVTGGFGVHAAIASLNQHRPLAPAAPPAIGYEADAHFPGALLLTAVADDAAPVTGMTGTAPLPALPADATFDAVDTTVRAAMPFRSGGSTLDRARALQCLTTAIYYEAASEPDNGQRAVAQVILNRVRHPAFPATVCGVVYQGSDKRGCQFSFACDGALARVPVQRWWERAQRVAARALAGDVFAPVGLATHYHTYAVTPAWNRGLVMTGVFGAHFFHRWKGWWGTASAFRDRYVGIEPMPGPLPRPDPVALAALSPAPAPATPIAAPITAIQSPHVDTGTPLTATAAAASALPDSQILDRWKDSGQPLR